MGTNWLRIPDQIRLSIEKDGEAVSLAKAVKQLLAQCIALHRPGDRLDLAPQLLTGKVAVIHLSDEQQAALDAIAARLGTTAPAAAVALLWKRFPTVQPPVPGAVTGLLAEVGSLVEVNARIAAKADREGQTSADQAAYYRQIEAFALRAAPGVLFAEASTGVGKTRAFLTALIRWCGVHSDQKAAIAVPTYQLMAQAVEEWRLIEAVGPVPRARAMIGQSGFVSKDALFDWIERCEATQRDGDMETLAAAQKWIEEGAPPNPSGAVLCSVGWTAEGLHYACSGEFLDIEDVTLPHRRDDSDEGYAAYLSQLRIGGTDDSQVFFLTHSMLAIMVREHARGTRRSLTDSDDKTLQNRIASWKELSPEDREGRLIEVINDTLGELGGYEGARMPKLGLLVVDEAHQLEQWVAQVNSLHVSVDSIITAMKQMRSQHQKFPQRAIDAAGTVFDAMRAEANYEKARPEAHRTLIGQFGDIIKNALESLSSAARKLPESRRLNAIVMMIDSALRTQGMNFSVPNIMEAKLEWSPDRKYPQMAIGRRDVSKELDYLWRNLVEKAILVSATLYEDLPQLSPETTRRLLSVPTSLAVSMTPIRPAWLFSPVTLFIAAQTYRPDGRQRFVRPSRKTGERGDDFENAYAAWADEVTQYIAEAWHAAAGGVLVLLTGYEDATAISDRLGTRAGIFPILAHKAGRSLATLKQQYVKAAGNGYRPLMLAVGGAWTGLDLSTDEYPDACTDLVIPVAPFGVLRSLTQANRVERTGIMAMTFASSIVFRQGLGRLVRSANTPNNRRIHFLDGRQHMSSMAGLFSPMLRWLSKYSSRRDV